MPLYFYFRTASWILMSHRVTRMQVTASTAAPEWDKCQVTWNLMLDLNTIQGLAISWNVPTGAESLVGH